jgi:hypothetical protein
MQRCKHRVFVYFFLSLKNQLNLHIMKSLESILNSPERMLSGEEMNNLKGGNAQMNCSCTYYEWNEGSQTSVAAFSQNYTVTNGTCADAAFALNNVYDGIWDFVSCN